MASSGLPSIPTPPPDNQDDSQPFNIVSHYENLFRVDPEITHPIAAIESLIALLSAAPPSTISETLSLLASSTATLKASVSKPISISAGTDLFQRYIISTLQAQANPNAKGTGTKTSGAGGAEDFTAIRAHLLENSRAFLERAKKASGRVAGIAKKLIRDDTTVLTSGRSEAVAAALSSAADAGTIFRVVYIEDSYEPDKSSGSTTDVIKSLRHRDIPVAVIPFAALATALPSITFALIGAESIVESGGVISNMGTSQIGLLMRGARKPFYVAAESYKAVRVCPLDGEDLQTRPGGLDFRTGEALEHEEGRRRDDSGIVDFTPADLITAIVTEDGVLSPSAISEELIKIWY